MCLFLLFGLFEVLLAFVYEVLVDLSRFEQTIGVCALFV